MGFDQLLHARIAAPRGGASKHDGYEVATFAVNRGDQVIARGLSIAGLYTVNPFDRPEQPGVIADGLAVKAEGASLRIRSVPWEAFLDGAPESGLVARSRDLFIIGETGGISVYRFTHT